MTANVGAIERIISSTKSWMEINQTVSVIIRWGMVVHSRCVGQNYWVMVKAF